MITLTELNVSIFDYLQTVPELVALVGERIIPTVLPANLQDALPCIVYDRVEKTPFSVLSGRSGLAFGTYVFNVLADTHERAATIQEVLELALEGKQWSNGVDVQGVEFQSAENVVWNEEKGAWEGGSFYHFEWTEDRSL